jgi:hypothetical protein
MFVRGRYGMLFFVVLLGTTLEACGSSSNDKGQGTTSTSLSAFSVQSSITDGQTLSGAVKWMATIPGTQNATSVEFLVDDQVKWREKNAPYYFDDDHGVLPPWLLGEGPHRLAVRATASDGRTATATAAVKVAATSPDNSAVAGTYDRMVTDADVARVAAYRNQRHGAFGSVPPTGKWTLKISPQGLVRVVDPDGGTSYEPYTAQKQSLTLYGPAVWLQPNPNEPFLFCDPEARSDYQWTTDASTLVITSTDKLCADRDQIFEGHWNRRA